MESIKAMLDILQREYICNDDLVFILSISTLEKVEMNA
jgi:hypothetical protein